MQITLFLTSMCAMIFCEIEVVNSSLIQRNNGQNLTMEICYEAQQEAISMGLIFQQSKILPLKVNSIWSKPIPVSTAPDAIHYQSRSRSTLSKWSDSGDAVGESSQQATMEFQSLCYPHELNQETTETCCSAELEVQLLRRTTEELHESLAAYLTRWSSSISSLRSSLREEVFQTLEQFRVELNQTLCDRPLDAQSAMITNCSEVAADLFPKFRLMVEQFIVGQGDLTLDISIPIDNLLMQLLMDYSCQSNSQLNGNTLEAFNEEIRCHKYCQARLNLILDSLVSNTDLPSMLTRLRRTMTKDTSHPAQRKGTVNNIDPQSAESNQNRKFVGDEYRLLYSPELLFTIRLNRILMQALELGESLIDGLKDFNAAQGLCMQKLMRMHHCALCAGETLIRPCPELCMTIVSSCLQPLSELHTPWKRFTDAVKIVANTFLEKPELSMMVQFRRLPRRLIAYFRHLLKTHKDWLQPQCSGTTRLLEILGHEETAPSRLQEIHSISKDATSLRSYRQFLQHVKLKMDQLADLWMRASSSICSESEHLASSTKQPDQCWNGTAKGRFHFDRCEFCDSHKSSNRPENVRASASGVLMPPGRRQRTSHIPAMSEMTGPDMKDFPASPVPGATYLFNKPLWNAPIQHEKNLATRRANELLVRASRDLQWSTDSLLGELQAFNSIQGRMSDILSGTSLHSPENLANDQTESWIQIAPTNAAGASNSLTKQYNQEDMSTSLGLLAYGSMLGWSVNEFGRASASNKIIHSATPASPTGDVSNSKSRKKIQSDRTNAQSHDANSNLASTFNDAASDGSGFQPVWSIYGWSQSAQSGQQGTPGPSALPASSTANSAFTQMEGSGVIGNPSPLPSFMEYADYPHLNSFHSFLNPENPVNGPGGSSAIDDEDYAPSVSVPSLTPQSTIPDVIFSEFDLLNRSSNAPSTDAGTKPDSNLKGADGKQETSNKANRPMEFRSLCIYWSCYHVTISVMTMLVNSVLY